jgi:hypothetical protein
MAGFTNKGKARLLQFFYQNNLPTNVYIALVTSAVAPVADTNTLSQLTEITAGNGYTSGGFQLSLNTTDWPDSEENDTSDFGGLKAKDVAWTAAGGSIPSGGSGARYAVLTDDNVTVGNREVWHYWSLVSDRTVTVGNVLTLQDLELQLTET